MMLFGKCKQIDTAEHLVVEILIVSIIIGIISYVIWG